jgi:hypothetical protein
VLSHECGSEVAVLCTGLQCEGTWNLALEYATSVVSVFRGQHNFRNRI